MHGTKLSLVASVVAACLWVTGCSQIEPPISTPSPMPALIPVTVEVTRIVTQQIVVEATPTPDGGCAPESIGEAQEIVIGAVLPLSSPGSLLAGFGMQTALNIAVTELNDTGGIGGKPIRLITYDSAGIPNRAADFAERLITQDCAVGLVGIYHDDVAPAVADIAQEYGVPLIVTAAEADGITANGQPEVFRVTPTRTMLARMPAQWMLEVGDYNQDGRIFVVLVAEDKMYDAQYIEETEAELDLVGIGHETLTLDLPSTDFSPVIARIVTMDKLPDAVFIYVEGEPALMLQSQILSAGIGPQKGSLLVNSSSALHSALFWQSVPDGIGTVVRNIGPWQSTVSARGQHFANQYGSYLGRWPEPYAFTSYDAIHLLAGAIEQSDSLIGGEIVASLEATDLELASGRYHFPFGSNHSPASSGAPDFMWHQWPDVQTLYLQYSHPQQPSDEMPVIWPKIYRTVDTPVVR